MTALPLLSLNDIRAGYGSAVVLDGISFDLPEHGGLAVLDETASANRRCCSPSWAIPKLPADGYCGAARTLRRAAASPGAGRHRLGGAGT